jgi:glutaminase
MAASNPVIGERVIADDNVRCILAEMMMEGLYERSDDWAFEVGLPGKSGVGGGLLAVARGRLAIAFSPLLDAAGNSVKGQRGVAAIAKALGANVFN